MIKQFLLAFASLAIFSTLSTSAVAQPAGGFQFPPAGKIQKVAENLYLIPGGGGNSYAYVTSRGVVLVDSKVPNNGQAIVDQLKTVTDKPVVYLINTHPHFDHTGGNAFFTDATIVTHENTAASLKQDQNFSAQGLPTLTYSDHITLFNGDDAVEVHNFGRSHTNGDSYVVFRKARAIATGDSFASRGQPIIDTRNGGSGIGYPQVISRVTQEIKDVDLVLTGHNPEILKWQDLVDFAEFTQLFLDHARASKAAGKTPEEAMSSLKLPSRFEGYTLGRTMLTGPGGNFETIYQELN